MRRDISPSDFAAIETQHAQAERIRQVLAPRRITPEILRSLQGVPEHVYGPRHEDMTPMQDPPPLGRTARAVLWCVAWGAVCAATALAVRVIVLNLPGV